MFFSTGTDSPVRIASWMVSPWVFSKRISAGTLSPASNKTTSPGTSDSPAILWRSPLRNTVAVVKSILRIASKAFSAFPS